MREIKFRAWEEDFCLMRDWDWVRYNGCNEGIFYPDKQVSKCILMQYTGLKDGNLKEVYEGDIVKYTKWNRATGGIMEITGVVEWNVQGGGMWVKNGKYYTILQELVLSGGEDGFFMDNTEVIGNIYQNADLLVKTN